MNSHIYLKLIRSAKRIIVAYAGLISFPGNDCVVVVVVMSASGKK